MDTRCQFAVALTIAIAVAPFGWIARTAYGVDRPALADVEVEGGWLTASSANGQIATLDVQRGHVAVWDDNGRPVVAFALPKEITGLCSSLLVARPDALLVGVVDNGDSTLRCFVIDLRRHRLAGEFVAGQWPAKVFASPGGWVVETVGPGENPRLVEYDRLGRLVRETRGPNGVVERAAKELGRAEAAVLRVAAVGGQLWAVPAGMYEVWLLQGVPTRLDVPPRLRVTGNNLAGDVGRLKLLQLGERADAATRRALKSQVGRFLGTGRPFQGFFPAVVAVASCQDTLGVLLDVFPERASGGCRLDVWQVSNRRLVASMPVPGVCPSTMAMAKRGAWVLQGRRFAWLPFPERSSIAAPRCSAGEVPVLKPADGARDQSGGGAPSPRRVRSERDDE